MIVMTHYLSHVLFSSSFKLDLSFSPVLMEKSILCFASWISAHLQPRFPNVYSLLFSFSRHDYQIQFVPIDTQATLARCDFFFCQELNIEMWLAQTHSEGTSLWVTFNKQSRVCKLWPESVVIISQTMSSVNKNHIIHSEWGFSCFSDQISVIHLCFNVYNVFVSSTFEHTLFSQQNQKGGSAGFRALVTLHDITCGKVISVSQLLSVCNPQDNNLDRSS